MNHHDKAGRSLRPASTDQAVALIRQLLEAQTRVGDSPALISMNLPQVDNTYLAVLSAAAEAESVRNQALGARLTSLARAQRAAVRAQHAPTGRAGRTPLLLRTLI